ncbi:MAG: GntR family transcriptional regulator [Jannaschia sp.]
MGINKINRPNSLFELATTHIRAAIVDGSIELGEQISELGISQRLGISKTPVREALQELRREGLVRIGAQRGTTVFCPDVEELRDIFEFRTVLELAAADRVFDRKVDATAQVLRETVEDMIAAVDRGDHRAYQALDSRFHKAIIDGAENDYLSNAYLPVSVKIDALRSRNLQDSNVVGRSLVFHGRLVDIMARGDRAVFLEQLQTHISNSGNDSRTWLDSVKRAAPVRELSTRR